MSGFFFNFKMILEKFISLECNPKWRNVRSFLHDSVYEVTAKEWSTNYYNHFARPSNLIFLNTFTHLGIERRQNDSCWSSRSCCFHWATNTVLQQNIHNNKLADLECNTTLLLQLLSVKNVHLQFCQHRIHKQE